MQEGEQTFQDIQNLNRSLARHISGLFKIRRSDRVSILPRASAKIRECCEYARRRGFKKVWIDTCCIDKTSSSELSEAINSMYEWYGAADVCFAYLFDVTDAENPKKTNASFRRSRWFKRGWTLQELIAPRSLQFISKEWHFIGTKASLADVVEQVTGIQREILTHERSLDSVSVARRMSWASRRETKRPEDEAYSLMGIFGVKMPTIYGEGRAAFLRLQEEILKHIRDQSIFAWGSIFGVSSYGSSLRWRYEYRDGFDPSVLFARSPAEFYYSGHIEPIPFDQLEQRLGILGEVPDYTITSYGVRSSFPSIVINTAATSALRLAVLGCLVKGPDAASRGKLIALLLTQQPNTSQQSGRFVVGARGSQIPPWLFEDIDAMSQLLSSDTVTGARTIRASSGGSTRGSSQPTLTDDMLYRAVALPRSQYEQPVMFYRPLAYEPGSLTKAEWARLCIAHRSRFDVAARSDAWEIYPETGLVRSSSRLTLVPMSYECPCEVIVPGWTITRLEEKGYSLWLWPDRRCSALALQVGFPASPSIYTLALCSSAEVILIHIGPCPTFKKPIPVPRAGRARAARDRRPLLGSAYPGLCVAVVFMPGPKVVVPQMEDDWQGDPHQEDCWMDHIDNWEGGLKAFKRGTTTLQIEFKSCPGAWTHQQQHQHVAPQGPGRPMFMMRLKINPNPRRTGTMSMTTGTSLR